MKNLHFGIHLTGLRLRDDGSLYQLHAGTVDVQEGDGRSVRRGQPPSSTEIGRFARAPQSAEEALGTDLWIWRRGTAPDTRLWAKHATFSHLARRHHWFEHDGVITLILHTLPRAELELELLAQGFRPMLATWRAPATDEVRQLAARVVEYTPETELVFEAAAARAEEVRVTTDPEGHRLYEAANHAWARFHALDPFAAAPVLRTHRRALTFGFDEDGEAAWTMDLGLVPGRITYPAVFTRGRNRLEVDSLSWRDFLRLRAIGRALLRRDTTRAMTAELRGEAAPVRAPRPRASEAEQLFERSADAESDANFSRLLATLRARQPALAADAILSPVGRIKTLLEELAPPDVTPDSLRTWLEDQAWFEAADALERREAESVDGFMDRLWGVLFEKHLVTSLVERDGSRIVVACSSLVGDGQDAAVLRLTMSDEGPEVRRIPVQVIDDCARGRCWVTTPGDALREGDELINFRRHRVEQIELLRVKLRALEAGLRRAPAALEQLREALTLATMLAQGPRCQGAERAAALETLERAKHYYDAARELYAEGRPAESLQHVYAATERVAAAAAEASLLCAEGVQNLPGIGGEADTGSAEDAPREALPEAAPMSTKPPELVGTGAELPSADTDDPSDVYSYRADVWCGRCGRQLRRDLAAKGQAPERPDDETTYDSDEFPKGPYRPDASDKPDHCAAGPDCLAAEVVVEPSGERRIGHFLQNPLTREGEAYVQRAIAEGSPVAVQIWAPFYGIGLGPVVEEDGDEEYLRAAIGHVDASPTRKPVKVDLRGFGPRIQHMLLRSFARSVR
ncbi:hypothetical protein [Nannocystis pusilla]|uniref:DUF4132 domain-containing protein n=1 Tax=Nannocystis pusilla TaxID=889268 RepID=A0ABS7TNA6_9BACT|nr:hypothetical protein [Nannocystis pusilla]MBZ5709661.1 hypothetical protein [Nannocystis pusilla]